MHMYTLYLRLLLITTTSLYAADGAQPVTLSKNLSRCFVQKSIRVPGYQHRTSDLFVQICTDAQTDDQNNRALSAHEKRIVIGSVTTHDEQTLACTIARTLACLPLTKECVAATKERLIQEYVQERRSLSSEDKRLPFFRAWYAEDTIIDMHTYKPTELPDHIFPPCLHAVAATHHISMADEQHRKLLQALGSSSSPSYRATYWKVDKKRFAACLQDTEAANDDSLSYTATDSDIDPDTSELEELASSDDDASCDDRLSDTARDADTPLDMSELDVDE